MILTELDKKPPSSNLYIASSSSSSIILSYLFSIVWHSAIPTSRKASVQTEQHHSSSKTRQSLLTRLALTHYPSGTCSLTLQSLFIYIEAGIGTMTCAVEHPFVSDNATISIPLEVVDIDVDTATEVEPQISDPYEPCSS